jgi:hypothetical protein
MSTVLRDPAITFDLVLGRAWSSRAIAWYGCGYGGLSHAAPMLRDGSYIDARNDKMTLKGQVIPAGVRRRPAGYLDNSIKHLRLSKRCSLTEYQTWENWLVSQIGDSYDQASILAFILGVSLTAGDGHWICSAMAGGSLVALNWIKQSELPFPLHECTPNSLLWLLAGMTGFERVDLLSAK